MAIKINETIDGIPTDAVEHQAKRRSATSPKQPAATKAGKADPYIWGIYLALVFISIVELYSASSSEVTSANVYSPLIRHCLFLGAGMAIVLWFQRLHYVVFSHYAWLFAIGSAALLVYTTLFGAEINGAQRAIKIAGFTIQPPEIIKLSIVVLLATILGKNQEPGGVTNKAVVQVAIVVAVSAALLWVNGLTNTVIVMGVSICLFLIGDIQFKKLLMVGAVYGVCIAALVAVKYVTPKTTEFDSAGNGTEMTTTGVGRQDTHKGRMSRYFEGVNPNDTINDYNRQVFFAKMAQANGGLIGRGPGNSRESARLPLAFSDYIFSIVVEDIGFIGGVCLILLYLGLLGRAGRLAYYCSRATPAFLIMGCAVLIVLQALGHMAIVAGLTPVSGQPLPFISKGGTSILVMSAAIGIMLSVSRYAAPKNDRKAIKNELNALPENMRAANVTQ